MEDVEKVVRAHLIGLAEDEAGHAQLRSLAKVEHADPAAAAAIEALLDGKASEDEWEILCGSFLYMVLGSEPDESVAFESGACGGADETNFYLISSGHALVGNLDGWLGAFESLDDALNHFDYLFPDVRIEDIEELAEVPEGVDSITIEGEIYTRDGEDWASDQGWPSRYVNVQGTWMSEDDALERERE